MLCIDPGHGGHDSGANYKDDQGKHLEKNIVLEIGKVLEHLLIHDSIEYTLTRASDRFVTLEDRCEIAAGSMFDAYGNRKPADCFISIHVDFFVDTGASGSTFFHYPGSEGKKIAEAIDQQFESRPIKRRGVRTVDTEPDDDKIPYQYVVANTPCPAVLIETGFLSNEGDRTYLTSHSGIYETAQSIYFGLKESGFID